ncbi:MAG: 16S rRNA (guanine(527)-N(7))-methyltransferase RsmG [Treponemataceae bacterium]|nr:MAG: 16S rRNA (guanine(527)-N(7))-methyltransferase RsmG [Treponemataceae bacterium]
MDAAELLLNGLERAGLSDSVARARAAALFDIYLDEIVLFSKTLNIASGLGREEIIMRHIFDSIAPFARIEELAEISREKRAHISGAADDAAVIADIGSGAGFPGIPLAVCASVTQKKTRVVLIERGKKKCAFLENCAALMHLSCVSVENVDIERAQKNRFDVCVFRSFHPLDEKLVRLIFGLTVSGGFIAAYKARLENIERELRGIESAARCWRVEKLRVPFLEDHERHLVIMEAGHDNLQR